MRKITEKLPYNERETVLQRLRDESEVGHGYWLFLMTSVIITMFGLLLNSSPIVIGGMIVAPLLYPLIMTGASIITNREKILKQMIILVAKSTLVAVVVSVFVTLLSPVSEPTNEILVRTSPNLIDLVIALSAGLAGAYAVTVKQKYASLTGVAVAAALVPPLSIIGYGLAIGSMSIMIGALLLYATNLIAVVLSTIIIFYLLGFGPGRKLENQEHAKRNTMISAIAFMVIVSVLSFVLFNTVTDAQLDGAIESEVQTFLKTYDNTYVESIEKKSVDNRLIITVTVQSPSNFNQRAINLLDEELQSRLQRDVDLHFLQIPVTKLVDG